MLYVLPQRYQKTCWGHRLYDDYFQDITSSKVDQFDPQTDQDIFDVWDDLAEKHRRLPKATFGKSEIAAGFHYSAHALLSDKYIRELLPPSSFLLDVMHLFWANGVVSWEVNAAYQRWQETKMGNLNEFLSLPWCFQQLEIQSLGVKVLATKAIFKVYLTKAAPRIYSFSFLSSITSWKVAWGEMGRCKKN